MRKNISCHPVSKIPGELSRNEAVPSHMEYDLTQFCLQPIEILEPPLTSCLALDKLVLLTPC